jgi:hypothetical protein
MGVLSVNRRPRAFTAGSPSTAIDIPHIEVNLASKRALGRGQEGGGRRRCRDRDPRDRSSRDRDHHGRRAVFSWCS